MASAFLADCGIARVESLEALIEALPLVRRTPIRPVGARAPRVAVLTTTAGGAIMVVDPLAMRGVEIAQPSAETFARFAAAGIGVTPARIVDLTVAGARYDVYKPALDILTTAPEFDMVLAVVGSSARFQPEQAVKPIIDSANAAKPIAAFLVPDAPDALAKLSEAGVPAFHTPEACADAIAAALARREPKPAVVAAAATGKGRVLDELEAYALLDRLGIPRSPAVALETTIAQPPTLPFPYPVAVKVLSADIPHKTEAGGVALNVRDGEALVTAIKAMRETVESRTGITPERVLVAPMVSGIGEALIGYRVDREAGPLVMVAAGGVFTEIYRDRCTAPCAGRSADRACHDRRSEGLCHAQRLPRQAGRRSRCARARHRGAVAARRDRWRGGGRGQSADREDRRRGCGRCAHQDTMTKNGRQRMLENLAARVNGDANLVRRGKHVNTSFLIAIDNADHIVRVEHGRIASVTPGPFITPNYAFALRARATPGRSSGRRRRSPATPTSSRW